MFDTRCKPHDKSPRTSQSQFRNKFVGLNDVPIPEDANTHSHGSHNSIDVDDIDVSEAKYEDEEPELNIPNARENRKRKKQAKCWNHFKLISTEKVVDGLAESKAVCKLCQQILA